MTQFTFYEIYKDVMEMLDDDATRGQFMKAICKFMFEEEPVKPPKGNKSETDFSERATFARIHKKKSPYSY